MCVAWYMSSCSQRPTLFFILLFRHTSMSVLTATTWRQFLPKWQPFHQKRPFPNRNNTYWLKHCWRYSIVTNTAMHDTYKVKEAGFEALKESQFAAVRAFWRKPLQPPMDHTKAIPFKKKLSQFMKHTRKTMQGKILVQKCPIIGSPAHSFPWKVSQKREPPSYFVCVTHSDQ